MKVAIWTASHLPDLGGYQWSTYRLAVALREMSHNMLFVTRESQREGDGGSVPAIRIASDDVPSWTRLSGEWLTANRDQFDVLHVIDYFYESVDEQLEWVRKLQLPAIVKTPTLGYVPKIFNSDGRKAGLQNFDACIAVSGAIGEEFVQAGVDPARVRFIPNGVDTHREFVPALNRATVRETLDLPQDATLVLYMGRLVHRKRVDLLLDAMAQQLAEAKLVIVGSSFNQRDSAEEEIFAKASMMDNVIMRPATSNAVAYYQASDIHVLLSEREGMPNTVLEGMACGLPTLATNIPGVREIVTDREDGCLVEVDDLEATVHALKTLVSSPELRREIGLRARTTASRRFDISVVAKQYEALYREIARR